MASTIEICNIALSTYLGKQSITDLEDNTPEAEQCSLHYLPSLLRITAAHWWDHCKTQRTLALLENDRAEWAFRYTRPADAISIIWVNEAGAARAMMATAQNPDTPRDIAGTNIYSDVANASACYTYLVDDPNLMPPHFRDAVSADMAGHMALALTDSTTKARQAMQIAQVKLDEAKAFDEAQTQPVQVNRLPDHLLMRGISL